MTSEVERAALAALDRFLATWNSRDKEAWADSLHYPHARPSPRGPGPIRATARDYAAAFDYARVLTTGWDRSAWDERRVVHASPDKVHVAGQWSRYDAGDARLRTNRVLYVVTRLGGRWGIQARFGIDSRDAPDRSGLERAARPVLEAFFAGERAQPVLAVEPGAIRELRDAGELPGGPRSVAALDWIQTGELGANAAVELAPRGDRAVVLLARSDGSWRVRALSILPRPD